MKPPWGKARIGAIAILSVAAFAIATAAVTLSHAQLASSPWPMFHHDISHTGMSQYDTSTNPGLQKWAFATGNAAPAIHSSPVIGSDGTIYVGGVSTLYGVNPDGTQKWAFATGAYIYGSPAIGADGTVYVGSDDHNLYALTDGGQNSVTQKWNFVTGSVVRSSPAIGADGTIYIGSGDNLYAVNPDGTEKWSIATGNGVESSPAIGADGTIYVGSEDHHLYAVNPDGT